MSMRRHYPVGQNAASAADAVPIPANTDVDLTDMAGPTGGFCARAILVGGTPGTLVVETMLGGPPRSIPLTANQLLPLSVSKVYAASTCAPIFALL